MNSYVTSPVDVDAIVICRGWCTFETYHVEGINLEFTTIAELVQVIPPCFELTAQPDGRVTSASWRREYGSGRRAEFAGTCNSVEAPYMAVEGWYTLTIQINADMPETLGRGGFGETGKPDDSWLYLNGLSLCASDERKGVDLVELEAELEPDVGRSRAESFSPELEAQPHTGRQGFQTDPPIVRMRLSDSGAVTSRGTCTASLRDNGREPVMSISVLTTAASTDSAGVSECFVHKRKVPEGTGLEQLMPHVIDREYDFQCA